MFRLIYFSILLIGCGSSGQKTIQVIDSEQLIELKNSGIKVVDVRTKKEYDQGHIPDVANIDFYDPDFLNKMEGFEYKNPIIIHCAKGGRSEKAANVLKKAGFSMIYDYSGGFSDWKSKGLEIEK